jgi:SAM-dependent methyltransferase
MKTFSSTNVLTTHIRYTTGKEAGMSKTASEQTERLKRKWEKEAPTYDRRMGFFERVLFEDGREWVCSRASGEVLEVAVGTGRNFPFYPAGVRLTGIDLSPAMLEIARKRAGELGLNADLRESDAQELPFPDASFDTVVCTLSLCNIPDDRRAIAEMKRVLRPGGILLLLDHVSTSGLLLRCGCLCSGCWNRSRGGSHVRTCCAGRWCTFWLRVLRSSGGSAIRPASSSGSQPASRASRQPGRALAASTLPLTLIHRGG